MGHRLGWAVRSTSIRAMTAHLMEGCAHVISSGSMYHFMINWKVMCKQHCTARYVLMKDYKKSKWCCCTSDLFRGIKDYQRLISPMMDISKSSGDFRLCFVACFCLMGDYCRHTRQFTLTDTISPFCYASTCTFKRPICGCDGKCCVIYSSKSYCRC